MFLATLNVLSFTIMTLCKLVVLCICVKLVHQNNLCFWRLWGFLLGFMGTIPHANRHHSTGINKIGCTFLCFVAYYGDFCLWHECSQTATSEILVSNVLKGTSHQHYNLTVSQYPLLTVLYSWRGDPNNISLARLLGKCTCHPLVGSVSPLYAWQLCQFTFS